MTSNEIRSLVAQGMRDFYCPLYERKVTLAGFHLDDAACGIAYIWDQAETDYEWLDTVDLTTLKELQP